MRPIRRQGTAVSISKCNTVASVLPKDKPDYAHDPLVAVLVQEQTRSSLSGRVNRGQAKRLSKQLSS
jgi:hypothetical protein